MCAWGPGMSPACDRFPFASPRVPWQRMQIRPGGFGYVRCLRHASRRPKTTWWAYHGLLCVVLAAATGCGAGQSSDPEAMFIERVHEQTPAYDDLSDVDLLKHGHDVCRRMTDNFFLYWDSQWVSGHLVPDGPQLALGDAAARHLCPEQFISMTDLEFRLTVNTYVEGFEQRQATRRAQGLPTARALPEAR